MGNIDKHIKIMQTISKKDLNGERIISHIDKLIPSDEEGQNLARVQVHIGNSVKIGEYNMIKIDFGIEFPVKPEDIKEGFSTGKDLIAEYIGNLLSDIKNDM